MSALPPKADIRQTLVSVRFFQRSPVRRQFKSDFRFIKSAEKFTPNLRCMRATRALSVAKSKGEHAMWKKLLLISVAAAGLSFAVADAQARNSTHSSAVTTHSRAALHARAQTRGPHFTPRGWHHGRKVGWHCRSPPRSGCKPPGLR